MTINTTSDDDWAVFCHDVHKSFAGKKVLTGVNLEVPQGTVLSLVGKNGAGKSTLISLLTGLLSIDSGNVSIAGMNVSQTSSHSLGKLIGLAPQELGIYPELSVRDNLREFGGLQGLSKHQAHSRADELIELMGLTDKAMSKANVLSGGQQRRLHTAIAMVHNPQILFLDEPTAGADVEARNSILEIIKRMTSRGMTIIYTSHYLHEIEQLGGELAFLINGRILVRGSTQDVIYRYAESSVRVRLASQPPENLNIRVGASRIDAWSPTITSVVRRGKLPFFLGTQTWMDYRSGTSRSSTQTLNRHINRSCHASRAIRTSMREKIKMQTTSRPISLQETEKMHYEYQTISGCFSSELSSSTDKHFVTSYPHRHPTDNDTLFISGF